MKKNGDLIFEELEKKINNKEKLTKQELISLAFTPIMGGKLTKAEKIIKSIRIVKSSDSEYKYDIESMLYAFADKFLKGKDLQKVKEKQAIEPSPLARTPRAQKITRSKR